MVSADLHSFWNDVSMLPILFDNLNFRFKKNAITKPTLGLEAVSLLKMNREDDLPKNLTIKNPTLPKRAFVDHLNTSKINVAQQMTFSLFEFV